MSAQQAPAVAGTMYFLQGQYEHQGSQTSWGRPLIWPKYRSLMHSHHCSKELKISIISSPINHNKHRNWSLGHTMTCHAFSIGHSLFIMTAQMLTNILFFSWSRKTPCLIAQEMYQGDNGKLLTWHSCPGSKIHLKGHKDLPPCPAEAACFNISSQNVS